MSSLNLFSFTISEALSMTILHSLWQGALILLVVMLLSKGTDHQKPNRIYFIQFGGLLSILAASVLTFLFYYSSTSTTTSVVESLTLSFNEFIVLENYSHAKTMSWQQWVTMGWVLGTLTYSAKLLLGGIHLYRVKKRANEVDRKWQLLLEQAKRKLRLNSSVKMLQTNESGVPFVIGLFKPVIIVPSMYFTQLSQREIESILLHELAHIRRHDFALNLVQLIIESLMFFNPFVWWLSNQMRKQREFSCDDAVRHQMGQQKTYLEALYKVALFSIEKQPQYSIALFNQNSELIMRMKRMLNSTPQSKISIPFLASAIGIMFLSLLFTYNISIGQNPANPTTPETITIEIPEIDLSGLEIPEIAPVITLEDIEIPNLATAMVPAIVESVTSSITPAIIEAIQPVVAAIPPVVAPHVVINPNISMDHDTLPTSPKLEELKRKMEQKAEEMEELAEQLEEQIENNVENDMERIEEMMEKFEEMQEEKLEKLEELEHSESMERLEELSDELEEVMEEYEEQIEESFPEEEVERIAERMEEKAEEYDSDPPLTDEQRKKLDLEMEALGKEMSAVMKEYELNHARIEKNPEIERIQKEMEAIGREMQPLHEMHEELWNSDDAKALQEQIHEIERSMNDKMRSINSDLQKQMELKAKEMEELGKQMKEEYNRLKKQKQE